MRLPDDDELYEVDQSYLGPPGRYIAVMRHKAIFAWLVIAPLVLVVVRRLDVPITLLTGGLLTLFTIWAAMKVADHTNTEVPFGALVQTLHNELVTPRPAREVEQAAAGATFTRATRPGGGWGRYLARGRPHRSSRHKQEGDARHVA